MDHATAHNIVVDIHKRAFMGLLSSHGIQPTTVKEAEALLDLGVGLIAVARGAAVSGSQSGNYGDGFFSQVKQAFDAQQQANQNAAPGFEQLVRKTAAPREFDPTADLPPALVDAAYDAARQLAQDPQIFEACCVKRAFNESQLAAAGG